MMAATLCCTELYKELADEVVKAIAQDRKFVEIIKYGDLYVYEVPLLTPVFKRSLLDFYEDREEYEHCHIVKNL